MRQYNENNMNVFKSLIKQHDFTEIFTLDDTKLAYNTFIQSLQNAHEQAFPQKNNTYKKKVHQKRTMDDDWITILINK